MQIPATQINAAGGGGFVLLEQHTAAASATLDFTSFISSTYDEYLFEMVSVTPATNSVNLGIRVGTGAGPSWASGVSDYDYVSWEYRVGGAATGGSGGDSILLLIRNLQTSTSNLGLNGSFRLFNPQNSAQFVQISGKAIYVDAAGSFRIASDFAGAYRTLNILTGVRFLYSSGNIASGTIRVYGIPK